MTGQGALWERADEIFDAALDRPAGQRKGFVEDACAGDADLLALVRRLLDAVEADDSLLDGRPVVEEATWWQDGGPPAPTAETSLEGQRLGPFEVGRELGRGGMAVVYQGERVDGQFRQDVAVKVLRPGGETFEVLARFRRERQILAGSEHPNIARLIDGGVTRDGRPYFVMERVDGRRIDHFCDEERLTVGERVVLLLQVARAVEDAHRRLVVHRDIKPSNVLVTEGGTAKLLDFGIAKVLQPSDDDLTRTSMRLMTPAYATPEQVRGEPVTTATDVYQLGLLLYELLTGALPYATTGSQLDVARSICEDPPTRPSSIVSRGDAAVPRRHLDEASRAGHRRTTPRQLRRDLRGDLEAILMKALRKEPERRYGSVSDLIADLERWREGRPVRARSGALGYRAGKFARRHRVAVAAAGLVLAILVAFSSAMAVQAQRLARERDRANREAETATRVAEFLTGIFRVSDPGESRGNSITAREVLDRGAAEIGAGLADRPRLRARLQGTMAEVYQNLGLYRDADRLAAGVVELLRRELGPEHRETLAAETRAAWLAHLLGRVDESEERARDLLARQRAALGPTAPETLGTIDLLARIDFRRGRYDRAVALHRAALDARRRTLGEHHLATLESLAGLGSALTEAGRFGEAERRLREQIALRRLLQGRDHPDTLKARGDLADLLGRMVRLEEAAVAYSEVIADSRRILGGDHPEVHVLLANASTVDRRLGRFEHALALGREAQDGFLRTLGPDHPSTLANQSNLALVLVRMKRFPEAEAIYDTVLATQRRLFGENEPGSLVTQENLANLYREQGRIEAARRTFDDLLRRARQFMAPKDPRLAILFYNAACLNASEERIEEALALLREAVAAGFQHPAIHDDPDLAPLRDRPEMELILAGVEANRKASTSAG